ncbi:MAG: NAD-dependent epimerase/dehydratase family protein [Chitinophagaceae bacterium]|nr:NAD-dependent epimerase/dehydratase family protein [Chitinophagaceae bacterium]
MRILIIGGTGNISRWFTQLFAERGDEIVLYNRGNKQLSLKGNIQYIYGDRTKYDLFAIQINRAGHFDCVIDMVGFQEEEAVQAVKLFAGRTDQYIFCSTVDVYSKRPAFYPIHTQHAMGASKSFVYGHRKMLMEEVFWKAHNELNFPLTVLRLAATYSEGWSPLVTCFGGASYHLDRIKKGLPIILHGDGNGIWAATHSSDAAKVFINAAGNISCIGQVYNVSGDELLTWETMHLIVAELLKAPTPHFVYIPTTQLASLAPEQSEWCVENFQYNNIFDNSPAKKDLGFEYTISYYEGARRCIRYLIENEGIEDCGNYPFYEGVLNKWNYAMKYLH